MAKHALKLSLIAQAQICASTEQTRYYLRGVYIDAASILVATDGHLLGAVRPKQGEVSPQFFAAFAGRILATLPPAALRAKPPTKRTNMDAFLVIDDETNALTITYAYGADDAAAGIAVYAHPSAAIWVDGAFPDWRRIIPRKAAQVAQPSNRGISTLLYPRIAEFFERHTDGTPVHNFPDPDGGAVVYRASGNPDAFLLAMPMRSDAPPASPIPDWA